MTYKKLSFIKSCNVYYLLCTNTLLRHALVWQCVPSLLSKRKRPLDEGGQRLLST